MEVEGGYRGAEEVVQYELSQCEYTNDYVIIGYMDES
jgi:hypothetical protein